MVGDKRLEGEVDVSIGHIVSVLRGRLRAHPSHGISTPASPLHISHSDPVIFYIVSHYIHNSCTHVMEGATALLSTSSHFPIASKDYIPSAFHPTHSALSTSTRKRKPVITYQSPGSGVVDVALLVRNTALEIEAAAAAARAMSSSGTGSTTSTLMLSGSAPQSESIHPPAIIIEDADRENGATNMKIEPIPLLKRVAAVHRVLKTPRPPRPLYHPLSGPGLSKHTMKTSGTSSSSTSQLAPATDTGRRSSSRTRRPAPKMRETESVTSMAKMIPEKPSPTKRRRGPGGGKRKRGAGQLEVDGDAAYPSGKRTRKPRERIEVDVENEMMPPPTTGGTSPPSGYTTRAKRPRKAAHTRGESSTSDGTGSVTRTTPVNGHVEEFWVPIKAT